LSRKCCVLSYRGKGPSKPPVYPALPSFWQLGASPKLVPCAMGYGRPGGRLTSAPRLHNEDKRRKHTRGSGYHRPPASQVSEGVHSRTRYRRPSPIGRQSSPPSRYVDLRRELKVKETDHSQDDGRSGEWVGYLVVGAPSQNTPRSATPYLLGATHTHLH
jgi:hypothetical protein